MNPPRAQYAFNGDVAIAYGVVGDGPVDLLYIQGFVSHVELMWEYRPAVEFFERIARWARLVTIVDAAPGCRIGSPRGSCRLWRRPRAKSWP